jgi:hypothetical protein
MKKMNKINWDIINAIQKSGKITSDDTWEKKLGVDPLYISDKDLVKQIHLKNKALAYYQLLRNWLDKPVDDMAWCVFREDSIEKNWEQVNKMCEEYRKRIKNEDEKNE